MLMSNYLCLVTTPTHKKQISIEIESYANKCTTSSVWHQSLILKVLQITSIARPSVSELSEAVRVSCGSFDQRKREGRLSGPELASYRSSPSSLTSLPVLGCREREQGSVWRGEREDKLSVQCSTAVYSTVLHCTLSAGSPPLPRESCLRLRCSRSQVYTDTQPAQICFQWFFWAKL